MHVVRLVRGDTWQRLWRIEQESGAPVDLAGASARLTVRDRRDAVLATASTADGRLVIGPAAGEITLALPAAVSATLPQGRHRFDLEVTFPGGRRQTYELAELEVVEDMSR